MININIVWYVSRNEVNRWWIETNILFWSIIVQLIKTLTLSLTQQPHLQQHGVSSLKIMGILSKENNFGNSMNINISISWSFEENSKFSKNSRRFNALKNDLNTSDTPVEIALTVSLTVFNYFDFCTYNSWSWLWYRIWI